MGELAKIKPTIMQMTLEKKSKVDLIRKFGSLSMQVIVTEQYPSVAALSRQYGLEKTEEVNAIILTDLSSSFDGELESVAIEEICAEISSDSELFSLSLEDVYFVCKQIKMSNTFGKLSTNKILTALKKHFADRCDAAAANSMDKHSNHKEYNHKAAELAIYSHVVSHQEKEAKNREYKRKKDA